MTVKSLPAISESCSFVSSTPFSTAVAIARNELAEEVSASRVLDSASLTVFTVERACVPSERSEPSTARTEFDAVCARWDTVFISETSADSCGFTFTLNEFFASVSVFFTARICSASCFFCCPTVSFAFATFVPAALTCEPIAVTSLDACLSCAISASILLIVIGSLTCAFTCSRALLI